jgi:hypothetical protein
MPVDEKSPRNTYWQLDGLMGPKQVLVHTKSLSNLMAALMERVFYEKQTNLPPAVPPAGMIESILKKFKRELLMNRSPAIAMHPMKYAECYSSRKRRIYEQAAREYLQHGVGIRDSVLKVFVKYEKILETGERVVPRLISPRSPIYNVALGCYLRPLEHKLYRRIGKLFDSNFGAETPVIAKGFNAEQTAELILSKFNRFDHPVIVGLDASRFDQHVCRAMLEWEHSIYRGYYPRDKELSTLLRMQLRSRGIGVTPTGKVEYEIDGTRASGDVNTALGNCLISAAILWTYLRSRHISKADALINGDDVIVFLEREQLANFIQYLASFYMKLGFRMKVEAPVTEMESIEFCQCHPVFDGEKWVMVRNFPDCMSKDSTIIHPVFAGQGAGDYLSSVGECGMSICGGIPVLQEYYHKLQSLGTPRKSFNDFISSGFQMMSRGMVRNIRPISEAARASFDLAFGIPREEQLFLEGKIRGWRWGTRDLYSEPAPLWPAEGTKIP